jgi:branched-subunit amino acid aminotransferase/4-amino-4-deoxychorismate lyase
LTLLRMSAWLLNSNGHWDECDKIPPDDRGFRYGMSVFETFLVHDGRLLFVSEHLARLAGACRVANFPVPRLDSSGIEGFAKSGVPVPDGSMIRIYVSAGPGSPFDPVLEPTVYLIADGIVTPAPEKPIRLGNAATILETHPAGVKSGNYWARIDALRAARMAGFDECVVIRNDGAITGCAMANLVVRMDEEWLTPRTEDGARPGVTIGWVQRHIPIRHVRLISGDLDRIDAAFITNSRIGPVSVGVYAERILTIPDALHALNDEWITQLNSHG